MYKELAKLLTNDRDISYSVTTDGERIFVEIIDTEHWVMGYVTFVPYLGDDRWAAIYRIDGVAKTGGIVSTTQEMLGCVEKVKNFLKLC
jgi:hypothetical protein